MQRTPCRGDEIISQKPVIADGNILSSVQSVQVYRRVYIIVEIIIKYGSFDY